MSPQSAKISANKLKKVAVIGAGTMGAGIAGVFASFGYQTFLYSRRDSTIATARKVIAEITGTDTLVTYTTHLESCLQDADIVSENIVEILAQKQEMFRAIEAIVSPDCLLTTNTSSISITHIAHALHKPDRFVGLHWFNPPSIMPLLEIIRSPITSDFTVAMCRALATEIGKETIEAASDIPGFIINRLQYAMLREALYLVETGVATIADIDRAVETTLAPRWAACGPLKLMDLAGLDVVANVSVELMPALSRETNISSLVKTLTANGHLGTKTGKGFYEWTAPEIQAAKLLRNKIVSDLYRPVKKPS